MELVFRKCTASASKKAKNYFKNKNPEDVKNICVVRHAAIGDWIVARPFLIELKKFFPNAKITLSVLRTAMYGMPEDLVDNIHIMDKDNPKDKTKKTSLWTRIQQAKQLPKQDIIFDLSDSTMTLLLILVSNPDIKIGYPYRWIRKFFFDITTFRSDFVLETQSMMHQLNILGANTMHYPLEYKLTTKKTDRENPYIIYFAGASMKDRCWGEHNFIDLIKLMKNKYPNYKHIILKGIKNDEQFNEIYEPFKDNVNVVHQDALPLEQIYDYLAQASLTIVGDTGIRNMAIGSNSPTLGIMWIKILSPLRYLPKTQNHQVVFNNKFEIPKVNDVFQEATKMMTNLYGDTN